MIIKETLKNSFTGTCGVIGAGAFAVGGICLTNLAMDIFTQQVLEPTGLKTHPAIAQTFFLLRASVAVDSARAGFSKGSACGERIFNCLEKAFTKA